MSTSPFPELKGTKKLTPLEMNKIAILKDHTVITFGTPYDSPASAPTK